MATESGYYVPESSKLPLIAATGMGLMAYGAASWVVSGSNTVFLIGAVVMFCVQYLIHIDNVKRKYSTNPLPPEIQTFRDLAIVIANSECDEFQKT